MVMSINMGYSYLLTIKNISSVYLIILLALVMIRLRSMHDKLTDKQIRISNTYYQIIFNR